MVCNALLTHAEGLREGYECLVANAPDTFLGSASDGQADDDEEKDDVYWATTKAMAPLKLDKIVVHPTALAVPGDWRATCFPRTPVSRSGSSTLFRSHVCQVPKCTKRHEVCL